MAVPKIERRSKQRFTIERELRYKVMAGSKGVQTGSGRTLNISSGGVAFETDETLDAGACIELSISWPALLEDACPLKLIALGRVLRSEDGQIASTIEKYEFRTQARTFAAQATLARTDSVLRRWADNIRRDCAKVNGAAGVTAALGAGLA